MMTNPLNIEVFICEKKNVDQPRYNADCNYINRQVFVEREVKLNVTIYHKSILWDVLDHWTDRFEVPWAD